MYVTIVTQGSKKGLYDHPGQVDFLAGQVTLHSHAPNKQGPRCVIYQLNHSKTKLRLARGKKSLRAAGLKGKLEFNFFFPEADNQVVNLNFKKKQFCPQLVTSLVVTKFCSLSRYLRCISAARK